MATAIFQLVNLSNAEYITIQQYNRATTTLLTPHRQDRFPTFDSPYCWYITPPSTQELFAVSRYLNVPVSALEPVKITKGYSYDPAD